jgi:hypothetical protein
MVTRLEISITVPAATTEPLIGTLHIQSSCLPEPMPIVSSCHRERDEHCRLRQQSPEGSSIQRPGLAQLLLCRTVACCGFPANSLKNLFQSGLGGDELVSLHLEGSSTLVAFSHESPQYAPKINDPFTYGEMEIVPNFVPSEIVVKVYMSDAAA